GWAIGERLFSVPDTPGPGVFPSDSPGPPPGVDTAPTRISQVQGPGGGGSGGGGGAGAGGGSGGGGSGAPLASGFNLPPAGETRFLPDSVLADAPVMNIDAIAARHNMTCPENVRIRLTGRTLHRCLRLGDQTVEEMIVALNGELRIAGAQPIYRFFTVQGAGSNGNAEQYAPEKLGATEAPRLATRSR